MMPISSNACWSRSIVAPISLMIGPSTMLKRHLGKLTRKMNSLSIRLLVSVLAFAIGPMLCAEAGSADQNLLKNPGFEDIDSAMPSQWLFDATKLRGKGSVQVDKSQVHSGRAAVRLVPTKANIGEDK